MKKSIILIIILLSVFTGTSIIIAGVATGIIQKNKYEGNSVKIAGDNNINKYVQYTIYCGSINIDEYLKGYVAFEDNTIVTINQEKSADIKEIYCKTGDMISKGSILYKYGNSEKLSPVEGKIINMDITGENILVEILDYSKTKIIVQIPEKYQNIITSDTEVKGTYGEETSVLKINNINPYINENMFQIVFDNNFKAYENSEIDITIHFATKENIVIINKECIKYNSANEPYINILNQDGCVIKEYIEIGCSGEGFCEILNGDYLLGKTAVIDKEELILNDN